MGKTARRFPEIERASPVAKKSHDVSGKMPSRKHLAILPWPLFGGLSRDGPMPPRIPCLEMGRAGGR